MIRVTQKPPSGSYFVLSESYIYDSIVALAKHEITPWWRFLREPKHVGAIVGFLVVFNIPMIL